MSPHGINSLVGDLVEMAKATERLPQLEAELDRANNSIEYYAKQVQELELNAVNRKSEIERLNDRIRSLEVERDDASFRVMEAEDLNHGLLNSARVAAAGLEAMINKLDPPKPEPVKEPEPVVTQAEGQSEVSHTSTTNLQPSGEDVGKLPDTVHSIQDTTQGQSESSPTAKEEATSSETVSSHSAKSTDADTTAGEPSHGPYFGKRYMEVNGLISRHEWHQGGGTDEDYDWRPSSSKFGDRSW